MRSLSRALAGVLFGDPGQWSWLRRGAAQLRPKDVSPGAQLLRLVLALIFLGPSLLLFAALGVFR